MSYRYEAEFTLSQILSEYALVSEHDALDDDDTRYLEELTGEFDALEREHVSDEIAEAAERILAGMREESALEELAELIDDPVMLAEILAVIS